MEMRVTMIKQKKMAICAVGASTAIALYVLMTSVMQHADASFSSTYGINNDGQTFGSATLAADYESEPDLILVQASNGKEGYVKKEDLHSAEGVASSPAGAVEQQIEKEQNQVQALRDRLDYLIADGIISKERADSVIAQAEELSNPYAAPEEDDVQRFSDTLAVNPELEKEFNEALKVTEATIPVYDVDGETVIGEFSVG